MILHEESHVIITTEENSSVKSRDAYPLKLEIKRWKSARIIPVRWLYDN